MQTKKRIAWNKGIPHRPEVKEKISRARKGHFIGQDNPFYGRKHTKETKELIGKKSKGRKWPEKSKREKSEATKGRKNSMYGVRFYGKDNHNYGKKWNQEQKLEMRQIKLEFYKSSKGKELKERFKILYRTNGSSYIYPEDFNEELKELIRQRDNYKCQICGCPQMELTQKLCIHHIDSIKDNCEFPNLISLCRVCHKRIHSHPELIKKR